MRGGHTCRRQRERRRRRADEPAHDHGPTAGVRVAALVEPNDPDLDVVFFDDLVHAAGPVNGRVERKGHAPGRQHKAAAAITVGRREHSGYIPSGLHAHIAVCQDWSVPVVIARIPSDRADGVHLAVCGR